MDCFYFTTFKPAFPLLGVLWSLLFVGGVAQIALWINQWLGWRERPLCLSALFFFVLAMVAAVVQVLAMASLAYASVLQVTFYVFCGLGALFVWQQIGRRQVWMRWARRVMEPQSWTLLERIGWLCLGGLIFGFALVSLGPPGDYDTISYHLAAPLDVLRHHGLVAREDWLTKRLAGAGEHFNLLGLSAGVEIEGAVLQWVSLLIFTVVMVSARGHRKNRLYAALAFAATPLLANLVPTQKHQVLPLVALSVGVLLLVRYRKCVSGVVDMLAFACVMLAMACKHSFILTGGVVILWCLFLRMRQGKGWVTCVRLGVAYAVVTLPFHVGNLMLYGDPISPLLEQFKASPNVALINLTGYIKAYQDSTAVFPLHLIIPKSWTVISVVLGFGLGVAVVYINPFRMGRSGRILLGISAAQIVLICLASQPSTRFLLDPFCVLLCAVAMCSSPIHKWQEGCVLYQSLLALPRVAVTAVLLVPGIWNDSCRDHVMVRASNNYALCQWLNEVLPRDAVVLLHMETVYFMPRKFVVGDSRRGWWDWSRPAEAARFRTLLKTEGVNTLVCETSDLPELAKLGLRPGRELAKPHVITKEYRALFGPRTTKEYHVYEARYEPEQQSLAQAPSRQGMETGSGAGIRSTLHR